MTSEGSPEEIRRLNKEIKSLRRELDVFTKRKVRSEKAYGHLVSKELSESEERFSLVIDASEQGIWDWNLLTNVVYYSPQWKKQIGYEDPELENSFSTWEEHLHPEDYHRCQAAVKEYLTNPKDHFILEFRLRHKDGSYRWIHNKASCLKNEKNEPVRLFGSHTDITDRKSSEEALIKSEALYKAIVSASPDPIIVTDRDGIIRMVSPSTWKMFDYTAENEVLGKRFIDFIYHEDIDLANSNVERLLNGETIESVEYRLKSKHGQCIETEIRGDMILSEENALDGFVFIVRDNTQRKIADNKLRYSETKYRTLVEAANDGIFILIEGIVVFSNHKLMEITGFEPHEVIGHPFLKFIPEEEKNKIRDFYYRRLAGQDIPELYETKTLTRSGKKMEVEINSKVFEYDGLQATLVMVRDISRRKSKERTESAILRLSDYAYRNTLGGLITRILDEAEDLTGSCLGFYHFLNEDQITIELQSWSTRTVKNGCYSASHEMHYPIDKAGVWVDCIREGKAVIHNDYESLSHRNGLPAGHVTLLRELVVPVFRAGKVVAIMGVGNKGSEYSKEDVEVITMLAEMSWDIIVRIKAESAIRELNSELENRVLERTAQLEAANKDLEAFAYSVSHDLRAPLRHIEAYTRILKENLSEISGEAEESLKVIVESTRKMNRMIEDLLSFSRLGRKSVVKTTVDLNELMEWVITDAKKNLKGRKVEWRVGHLPVVLGDANLLVLALENLVSNALKFTSRCEQAIIDIGCEESDSHLMYIRDNGVGFDMKYADKLFGVFQRLHTQEEFEGTGVGLANVRQIIQKHGGTIYAEASPGQGACFYLKL